MTRSRVAWILCSNRWNSALTEYALSSARALRLKGWTVFFSALVDSPAEQRAREYDLLGDSFHDFGLSEAVKLRRLQNRLQADAVLLFGGPETFLSRLIPGVPRFRFRGLDQDLTGTQSAWKNRLNMQPCAAILVPAKILQERFEKILLQPVHAVPLGIDGSQFFFQPEAFANARRPTLRIVGRLDPIKGHQSLFRMFRQLLQLWPKNRARPRLEVLGQSANISAPELRRMANASQLLEGEDWSLVSERVAAMGEKMSATDLGIISSLGSEVICRVAEEFLLCGVPLFVSGVGSLEECLVRKEFGTSYKNLNEEYAAFLLAEKLWDASREREQARRERAEAASKCFGLESMGAALDIMLRDFLPKD